MTYLYLAFAIVAEVLATTFLKLSDGGRAFSFTTDFMNSDPHVWKFLLVPQAWSLSIELAFYLLAPLLVRCSTGALVGVHTFGGFNMSGTDSKAGGRDYLMLFMQAKLSSERVGMTRKRAEAGTAI